MKGAVLLGLLITQETLAADYTGTVEMLEVWKGGNVAFTLFPTVSSCNSQFILNVSDVGTKSIYAALLAAKKTASPVRVSSPACGPAEGGIGSYNLVNYLYVLD